jgi:hypothetical protein
VHGLDEVNHGGKRSPEFVEGQKDNYKKPLRGQRFFVDKWGLACNMKRGCAAMCGARIVLCQL